MANSFRAKPWTLWFRSLRYWSNCVLSSDPLSATQPPEYFVLVGCQRSGTHLLREIVNSNPALALMVETFSLTPKRLYWCNYLRSVPRDQFPSLTPEIAMDVFDEHLRQVRKDILIEPEWYGGPKPDLKTIGLDVKYNQLKCFTSLSNNLCARPMLLDYFKSRSFRVVHMVRKNLAQAALSLILANIRNVWHNYDGSEFKGQYEVSWPTLHSHMKWIRDEREEFERLSQDLPMLTCVYEDLVDDLRKVDEAGAFPEETKALSPLAEFLGVSNQFVYDGQMKKVVSKPYSEILENFDELITEMKNSEFSEFADSLRASVRPSQAA